MKKNTGKTLRYYFKKAKNFKFLLAGILLSVIISVIMDMLWPLLLGKFFDSLTLDEPKEVIASILYATLVWIIVIDVIQWLSRRFLDFGNVIFQSKIMKQIKDESFEYLHKHSYRFFSNNFSGGLVKKVNRLSKSFEGIADSITYQIIPLGLKILIVLGALFYFHYALGLIILIWVILFLILTYSLSIFKLKYDLKRAETDTMVTAALSDTITNNSNIKMFAAEKFENRRFEKVTTEWRKRITKSWNINVYIDGIQGFLMIVLELLILYAAIRLWVNDVITVGIFFVIQAYLFQLFMQLWNFGRSIRDIYEYLAEAEEMIVVFNTPHEVKDKKNAKNIRINNGTVEFKNVDFSYKKSQEDVIKNLSLKVKSGQQVALIGPSGGGKSTIVKLMLRLFDLNKGKILIDGQDISKVSQESLRKEVALVPQDPILFHRTLMENIRYGNRDSSDEAVLAASKMAHCHEFIEKFPEKYKTLVGERGIKLSGGQRQRIAIARAILSNASILILDEATSSLDSESEVLIQEALKNLIKNKTTFIIAHRLSTIMKVDEIVVIKDGEIIEKGKHGDLINKKGSLYKKLWNLQVGGYLN